MTNTNNKLELNKDPTPAGEAGDFQSADEAALEAAHKKRGPYKKRSKAVDTQ